MTIVAKEPCPQCREQGGDKSGDNLKRYDDGHAWCFTCKYREPKGGPKKETKMSSITMAEVLSLHIGHDKERQIHDDVIKEAGIRYEVSPTTGKLDKLYYPYYDNSGACIAYKVRTYHPKKDFFWVGQPPGGLWGKNITPKKEDGSTKRSLLIVTEGEEDALAIRSNLKTKPPLPSDKYDVVSLADGASMNDKLREDTEFFEKYKGVILWLDSDTPGQDTAVQLADFLAPVVPIKNVKHPMYKDASDAHLAGEDIQDIIKNHSTVYEPEGIVCGVDITLDSLLEPIEEGVPIPFDGLQEKLHGLRKGEIVTVCAGSGIGKSTLVRELTKALIDQRQRVANVALEDQMKVAAQSLIALDMNIPLATFRFNPPDKEDPELKAAYEKYVASGDVYFYKHFGGLTKDTLINKLRYYARSKSCDFIILDHLSMVISNSPTSNERKDIDSLMTDLAKLVVETGVGIIQIVHLKRKGEGTGYAKGGEVELTDLRGSAALEQLSWAVVGLERDQQGDNQNSSKIRVLKNRTLGFTGLADTVRFDPETGRMMSIVAEPPELVTEELDELAVTKTTEPTIEEKMNEILHPRH